MKTNPNERTILAYLRPIEDNLNYPMQPIAEDMLASLSAAMDAAESDEAELRLMDDWMEARPHVLKTAVLVPDAMQEAAFGDGALPAGQVALVKRYGLITAESIARSWQTTLGSIKPGKNPKAPSKEATAKIIAKAKAADDEGPSRNPWHPRWNAPGKTDAERLQARQAAQSKIIVAFGSATAVRFAKAAGVTLAGAPLRK